MTGLGLALKGDLRKSMDRQLRRIKKGVKAGTASTAKGLQGDLRAQTRHAKLGRGLEKAWRFEVYPRHGKISLHPAAIVFSNAKRIHAAFSQGAQIRVRKAKFLVIPLPAAKKFGFDMGLKHSKGNKERKWSDIEAAIGKYASLRYVKIGPGKALLVADNLTSGLRRSKSRVSKKTGAAYSPVGGRRASAPLFLLVKQVRIKRKIDVKRAVKRANRDLGRQILKHLSAR